MNNTLKEAKSSFLSLSLPEERKMGSVHSVFMTSFNVMVEGKLINFSQQGMSLSAHGCIVNRETMTALLQACKPGDIVKVSKPLFSFYTSKGVLKIDLSKMEEIDLSIPRIAASPKSISGSSLYKVLELVPFEREIGLPLEGRVKEAVAVLQTVSKRSGEERETLLGYLIGRGKGLTPSGDDMLMGFTMIRKAVLGKEVFEEELQEQLKLHNTTDISKAYYGALFAGYVSSLFVSLIASLETTNAVEVSRLVTRIGYYGHTSGYDTLFGVYLGLKSLIHEMEE